MRNDLIGEQNGVRSRKLTSEERGRDHVIQHKRQFAPADLLSLDTNEFIDHLEERLGRLAVRSLETSK